MLYPPSEKHIQISQGSVGCHLKEKQMVKILSVHK